MFELNVTRVQKGVQGGVGVWPPTKSCGDTCGVDHRKNRLKMVKATENSLFSKNEY